MMFDPICLVFFSFFFWETFNLSDGSITIELHMKKVMDRYRTLAVLARRKVIPLPDFTYDCHSTYPHRDCYFSASEGQFEEAHKMGLVSDARVDSIHSEKPFEVILKFPNLEVTYMNVHYKEIRSHGKEYKEAIMTHKCPNSPLNSTFVMKRHNISCFTFSLRKLTFLSMRNCKSFTSVDDVDFTNNLMSMSYVRMVELINDVTGNILSPLMDQAAKDTPLSY